MPPKTHNLKQLEQEVINLKTSLRHAEILTKTQAAIIESNQAQLVIQNLHLRKLNGALYGQETRKKTERTGTLIFGGKAQCLSTNEIRTAIHAQEEKRLKIKRKGQMQEQQRKRL